MYTNKLKGTITQAAETAKCPEHELVQRINSFKDHAKELEKQIAQLQSRFVNAHVSELLNNAIALQENIMLVVTLFEATNIKEMELLSDRLKEKSKTIAVIGSEIDGKAHIIASINSQLVKTNKNLSAGSIVKILSEIVDGKGGGRPDFARGGGSNPAKLLQAIQKTEEIVKTML